MLELVTTGAFRKDLKLAKKRGYDLSLLETVLNALLEEKNLGSALSRPCFNRKLYRVSRMSYPAGLAAYLCSK